MTQGAGGVLQVVFRSNHRILTIVAAAEIGIAFGIGLYVGLIMGFVWGITKIVQMSGFVAFLLINWAANSVCRVVEGSKLVFGIVLNH
jgi:hypothetical protein